MSTAAARINARFTVLQAMELARLCHQFKDYPIISDCYAILFNSVMEQAPCEAIKEVADTPALQHHENYFPEFVDTP